MLSDDKIFKLNAIQIRIASEISKIEYATTEIIHRRTGIRRPIIKRNIRILEDYGWVRVVDTSLNSKRGKSIVGFSIFEINPSYESFRRYTFGDSSIDLEEISKSLKSYRHEPIRKSKLDAKISAIKRKLNKINDDLSMDGRNQSELSIIKSSLQKDIETLEKVESRKPTPIGRDIVFKIYPFFEIEMMYELDYESDEVRKKFCKEYNRLGTFEESCGIYVPSDIERINQRTQAYLNDEETIRWIGER